jgi:hypothetical protein
MEEKDRTALLSVPFRILQTLPEELQTLPEELQTLPEELQTKITIVIADRKSSHIVNKL